jgi:hypothetical protein
MRIETDADRFVQEQLQPLLRQSEQLECAAYLATTMSSGSVVAAARAKAYWAAFSNQRLFLIAARLGAFRPLRENRGVMHYERGQIAAAAWGVNVVFRFPEGNELQLQARRGKLSSQPQFIDLVRQQYGQTPAAQGIQRSISKKNLWSSLLGFALAGAYLAYALYFGKAKVRVVCAGVRAGIQCTLSHKEGGATAKASWRVVVHCANGKSVTGHASGKVRPHQSQQVLLTPNELEGLHECDKATSIEVASLQVK